MRMATGTKAVTASTLIPAPRTHKFILCAENLEAGPALARNPCQCDPQRGEPASGGRLGGSPTALAGDGIVGSGDGIVGSGGLHVGPRGGLGLCRILPRPGFFT